MRVIAGQFKGRRLDTPSWEGLRPTSDKLRETLFNILALRVDGARVLDAFAGTGAIGIEALSRGAASVTFIDSDRRAIALIEQNLALCGIESGVSVERGDVAAVLGRVREQPFDIVVLDPPYDFAHVGRVLDAVGARLAPGGLVVLERATKREPDIPPSLVRTRDVKSGDSTLTFLALRDRRSAAGDPRDRAN
jgi:16S rRNA (guanine966-N2)-methyltransferase